MNPQYIVIHHQLTKDGQVVDWEAVRRYWLHQPNPSQQSDAELALEQR